MSDTTKITWAQWEEIRKAPDIRDRFKLTVNPSNLIKGVIGALDGKDLLIMNFWDTDEPANRVESLGLTKNVEAALGRLRLIVTGAYHQGTNGISGEDDLDFLLTYFKATQELLSNARDWAGGFNSEDGFIGPHRYAMALAESVQKMDKLEGCTCPEDDSGDMTPGCPVHDEGDSK